MILEAFKWDEKTEIGSMLRTKIRVHGQVTMVGKFFKRRGGLTEWPTGSKATTALVKSVRLAALVLS